MSNSQAGRQGVSIGGWEEDFAWKKKKKKKRSFHLIYSCVLNIRNKREMKEGLCLKCNHYAWGGNELALPTMYVDTNGTLERRGKKH